MSKQGVKQSHCFEEKRKVSISCFDLKIKTMPAFQFSNSQSILFNVFKKYLICNAYKEIATLPLSARPSDFRAGNDFFSLFPTAE